jgi:hypothetical protein
MHLNSGKDFLSVQRGPTGAAKRRQEISMNTFTPNNLANKTDRQLTAMFQEASQGLSATGADLAAAQKRVAMIRLELARRVPAP